MRIHEISLALLLAATPVLAQVTVDPRALDSLKPGATATAPAQTPQAKPAPKPQPNAATKPAVRAPGPTNASTPAVPAAAPPLPVVPPPIMVPTRPPAPAIPATVTADAPGDIMPLQGGLRLTFGPGRADLNPGTEAAVRALVHRGGGTTPASDNSSFTITTYASGTPDDPSTSRRLSLARALAVRSVLIGQGVASPRIYPRAWGPNQPGFNDGPPDRADITLATNPVPNVTAKPR
jgi:outer membrane protein OmpA-like peptidoglycan-associated protein